MIQIITDSSSEFTKEEMEKNNIILVPMHITFGEESYQDVFEIGKDEFYKKLTTNEELPFTSQPSPGDFLPYFKAAKEAGDDVVVILLSSALSGTFQSAVIAKTMVEYDHIYLIDSLSATYAQKLLVDRAILRRKEGKSAPEIEAELNEIKGRVRVFAAIDTMKYLYKGGRISGVQAGLGTMVNLKVIITIKTDGDGSLDILGKVRGAKKAVQFIYDFIAQDEIDETHNVYPLYTMDDTNCREMMKEAPFPVAEAGNLGATIGTHIGPGAFGFVYVKK